MWARIICQNPLKEEQVRTEYWLVDELREISLKHAQNRAKYMQRLHSTSLSECATEVQNLEQTRQKQREEKESLRDSRSKSFDQRPVCDTGRNERIELLEKLERGPVQYKPPVDDLNFERLEPNSQTKLKCVSLFLYQDTVLDSYALAEPYGLSICVVAQSIVFPHWSSRVVCRLYPWYYETNDGR